MATGADDTKLRKLHRVSRVTAGLLDAGLDHRQIMGMDGVPPGSRQVRIGGVIALPAPDSVERRAHVKAVRPVRRSQPEDLIDIFRQFTETLLADPQRRLSLAARTALFSLPKLAHHHRHQALEIVLHDAITRTGAHDIHRGFLADTPGNHDHRQIRIGLPQDHYGGQAIESRQLKIANRQVPLFLQRLLQSGPIIDSAINGRKIRFMKFPQQQLGVEFGILDNQQAKIGGRAR